MVWWKKAAAFTTGDLAVLGLIATYFGNSLTVAQKITILIVGFALIPIVMVMALASDRLSVRKARLARVNAVAIQIRMLTALVEGLRGLPEQERVFFRNQLFTELVSILGQLRGSIVVTLTISYSIWNSKSETEKIRYLGANDFQILSLFYAKIDRRNHFYAQAVITTVQEPHYDASRLELINDIKQLFDVLPWLKARKIEVNWPPNDNP